MRGSRGFCQGVGVVINVFYRGLVGSNCFSKRAVQVFLRKHIATFNFSEVPDPPATRFGIGPCNKLILVRLKANTGLENSTRPLIFTSVSGCRASEYFEISTEN